MEEANVLAENIVTADLSNEKREVSVHGLSQWDHGQVLRVTGLKVDDGDIGVHFSLQRTGDSALVVTATVKNGVLTAPIPNILLTETCSRKIYVFIYLEDAESGQTIRNLTLFVKLRPKPDDYVYTETEVFSYKALADRVSALEENPVAAEQVQADWNQNDETASDYIKNRPFYTSITGTTVIIPETTEDYYEPETYESLVAGKEYTVVYDGVEYKCTAREEMLVGLSWSGVGIGNTYMASDYGGREDADKPFYVVGRDSDKYFNIGKESTSATIEVYTAQESVTKIDSKYLPSLGVGAAGKGKNAEIFNDYENNVASGSHSHAEGSDTNATAMNAHAEGQITTASGEMSHAEGNATEARGSCSHAEGSSTKAYGNYSHAEGYRTKAHGKYQHVQGIQNREDTNNKYAHIVGNGINSSALSNAHTIDWDGNGWFAGEVKIGGYGQEDSRAKTLATTEDVDKKTEKFVVTFTFTGTGMTLAADKTYDEINTAYQNGAVIVGKMDYIEFPMIQAPITSEKIFKFLGISDGVTYVSMVIIFITATNDIGFEDVTPAASNHTHDSAYDTKGSADTALASAKTYADSVKDDLLNGAGAAYDTLKELGDLIDTNTNAIEALETVATGKANAEHTHEIADVTGLQTALDNGKNFVVNVTMAETTTADKTYDEIVEAYNSGRNVIAALGVMTLPLLDVESSGVTFCTTVVGKYEGNKNWYITSVIVIISNDNSVSFSTHLIDKFSGATSSASGYGGLVPAPAAGNQDKFLKGDGTWGIPTDTTYSAATTSEAGLMSADDKSKLDGISSGANAYTLPIATSETLGGVKPVAKTDAMTQSVGVDANGALYTESGLPSVSTADNDKFLRVVNGAWAAVTVANAEGVSF